MENRELTTRHELVIPRAGFLGFRAVSTLGGVMVISGIRVLAVTLTDAVWWLVHWLSLAS